MRGMPNECVHDILLRALFTMHNCNIALAGVVSTLRPNNSHQACINLFPENTSNVSVISDITLPSTQPAE